jgi:hypothetical protein
LGNLFVTLENVQCGGLEDHEIYANYEENCSESWLEFQQKWLQFLVGFQFPVQELCTDVPETQRSSSIPKENNRKTLRPAMWVAIRILPQIAQYTGSTRFTPQNSRWELKCGTRGKVWHHTVVTRLNSFESHQEEDDLYSSPSIIRIIKSRRMRWAGNVA